MGRVAAICFSLRTALYSRRHLLFYKNLEVRAEGEPCCCLLPLGTHIQVLNALSDGSISQTQGKQHGEEEEGMLSICQNLLPRLSVGTGRVPLRSYDTSALKHNRYRTCCLIIRTKTI